VFHHGNLVQKIFQEETKRVDKSIKFLNEMNTKVLAKSQELKVLVYNTKKKEKKLLLLTGSSVLFRKNKIQA
jgi:hypothetical protein